MSSVILCEKCASIVHHKNPFFCGYYCVLEFKVESNGIIKINSKCTLDGRESGMHCV